MISVVISNFNYGIFLEECICSVLQQTYEDYQIIVVDDGSTDCSSEILKKISHSKISVINKANGGQLSCFNAAIPYIKGDLVAFLDSDDCFCKNYLAVLQDTYLNNNIDFVFSNFDRFGAIMEKAVMPHQNITLQRSKYLTYCSHKWVGGPTSTLSMKTKLLNQFLPMHDIEHDWKIRADDILVWGASLCGARKMYLCYPLVKYRVHSNNNFYGTSLSQEQIRLRQESVSSFFSRFDHLEEEVKFQNVFAEALCSNIPYRYYIPYLLKNKVYSKIAKKIVECTCRTKDVYSPLII